MNREQRLAMADAAAERAASNARDAERYARTDDHRHKTAPLAAAGALWADIARAHTAIAQALPETEDADV
ncbi:hypothetical protein [Streptomyces ureilyticus]|uniref:Uncharacterized protein n=1 Tax=Streptomyces ureilyticus TaxID=1775131 RepID=A0ABX0DQL2_9ACTN|nr:hypothetical protein [Streptomyces ureilyticus]NGO43777.1 hypothetical protein [Streptomyces ureilyticus]